MHPPWPAQHWGSAIAGMEQGRPGARRGSERGEARGPVPGEAPAPDLFPGASPLEEGADTRQESGTGGIRDVPPGVDIDAIHPPGSKSDALGQVRALASATPA